MSTIEPPPISSRHEARLKTVYELGSKHAAEGLVFSPSQYRRDDYQKAYFDGFHDYRKPHASPSQLGLYFKCGEAYRRRYIEGERRPPRFAMLRGSGVHSAAEHNFKQKVETHEDLPRAEIVEAGVESFNIRLEADGVELDDDERSRGLSIVRSEVTATVATLAGAHADQQAPDYQPTHVEQTVRLELPNASRDLLGVIDVIAEPARLTASGSESSISRPMVVDFKTSGKRKNAAELNADAALTFYAAAASGLTGFPVSDVRLDILLDQKRGVQRQIIDEQRGTADLGILAARTSAFLAGVDAGIFTPAMPGAWWCSPKWCGFWSDCKFVNAERTAAAKTFDV